MLRLPASRVIRLWERCAQRGISTSSPEPSHQSLVLRVYREMLKLASTLSPEGKRIDTLSRLREGFRKNKRETDQSKLQELLKGATSRLSFLRIATAHRPTGHGTFIVKDGKLVEGKADPTELRPFSDKRVTDEQIRRHKALWRKQRALGM